MSPRRSLRSSATRCATLIAAIRRGCVHTMDVSPPLPASIASSSRNCGSCVVLPQPVSPLTTTTWCDATASSKRAFASKAGSFRRKSSMRRAAGDCSAARWRSCSCCEASRDAAVAVGLGGAPASAPGVATVAAAPPSLSQLSGTSATTPLLASAPRALRSRMCGGTYPRVPPASVAAPLPGSPTGVSPACAPELPARPAPTSPSTELLCTLSSAASRRCASAPDMETSACLVPCLASRSAL
mmetsp:Transcript_12085/g.50869  ORF Transcript_12085/g.50869 Transcript_12085/m.50869 type:complete len:242 (-) Transcript_12085:533-1258(-)